MRSSTIAILIAMAVLAFAPSAHAQFDTSGYTTMQLTVGPEAAIQIDTGTTNLSTSGAMFANPYIGTTAFTYKIRTTRSGGTGNISLSVTSDFSPGGGPSVITAPSPGDALTYTCTVATPGSACSGTQTAVNGSGTAVANFGENARSAKNGTSGNSVSWNLTNDPVYSTGAYQATVTFTISAA